MRKQNYMIALNNLDILDYRLPCFSTTYKRKYLYVSHYTPLTSFCRMISSLTLPLSLSTLTRSTTSD